MIRHSQDEAFLQKQFNIILAQFTSINNFELQMSSQTHKNQFQSLSSLSLSQNLREVRDSQVFPSAGRKSSFDLVNILGDSNYFNRSKVEKSLDMLNSSIAFMKQGVSLGLNQMLAFNDQDRRKGEKVGCELADIDRIESEDDFSYEEDEPESPLPKLEVEPAEDLHTYKLNQLLPEDLAQLLMQKEIPLEYVRGLLLVKDQREIKSLRRLKVQRYLQKRRKKTWNKKICYNCRQKVAEQRLRIKGKFIKKRRALQILGLVTPISTNELKRRLEILLKDKSIREIQEIIKREE